MNSSDFLKIWFQRMVNQYPWIGFKYQYSTSESIHYIAVYPQNKVEIDEEYCKEENDFYESLSKKYPSESFVFGNEGVNFVQLKNPDIVEYKSKAKKLAAYPVL